MPYSIRSATRDDRDVVRDVADSSGLFTPDDSSLVVDVFDEDQSNEGLPPSIWLVADEDDGNGVAYCAPEADGDEVWNLLFLSVAPASRGRGVGRGLVEAVRSQVMARGARLLLVETSSTPAQEAARRLYGSAGFQHVGTIPDYYGDADDKVIFSLRLGVPE